MSTHVETTSRAWRRILIGAELLVLVYAVVIHFGGRHVRQETGPWFVLAILVFAAWAFLFLGSPFLVRSHGRLAILGWGVAVGALLFPVL